ncbi:hypothetical protein HK097_003290 [Rhizophlyctis rosea]|uniref:Uncharacterized protein n=1 Tax=Rhizophlyctis rosea TaxID=64517 RepID=A0AAD5SEZ2_9FUNG|nr:hypothetical protein HK097_003290 [Rhizophlyctis rosea]
MSARPYREDHRLRIKIVEAKNLTLNTARLTSESLESYCIVAIQRKLPEQSSPDPITSSSPFLASANAGGAASATGLPGLPRRKSAAGVEFGGRLSSASAVDLRRMSANTNAPGVTPTSGGGVAMSIRRGSLGTELNSPRRKSASVIALHSARNSVGPAGVGAASGPPSAVRTKAVVGAAPFWGEEWEFELDDAFHAVILQIHKKTLLQKDPVIGQLLLPVISLDLDNRPHEDWFALQTEEEVAAGASAAPKSVSSPHRWRDAYMTTPSPCWQCNRMLWHDVNGAAQRCDQCGMASHKSGCAEKIPHNCGSVGSVRVWYSYTREPILPLRTYGRLKDIILDPSRTALRVFSRVCEDQEDAALHILQIAECAPGDAASDFVTDLCVNEIEDSKDPATLFRGNTMATKTLDVYMKLVGMSYLREVLLPHIKDIMRLNKDCEIDPMKMEGGDNPKARADHLENLEGYILTITKAITSSYMFIPAGLRSILTTIFQTSQTRFPTSPTTFYTSVTSFLFLRFFTAAILGPKLWTLLDDHPPPRQARTFTLISKTMQQAANMTEFDGIKEPFTSGLNPTVRTCMGLIKGMVDTMVRDEEERRKKRARRRSSALRSSLLGIKQKLTSTQEARKKSMGGSSKISGSLGSSMHVGEGAGAGAGAAGVRGSASFTTLERARRGTLQGVPEGKVADSQSMGGANAQQPSSAPKRKGIFGLCCGGDEEVSPSPNPQSRTSLKTWSEENITPTPLQANKRTSSQHGSGGIVPTIPTTSHPSPVSISTTDLAPKAATLIDVERHLAAIHRHLLSTTDKMLQTAQTEDELAAVSALVDAVKEIQAQGSSEERKRMREEQLKLVGAVGMERADSESSESDEDVGVMHLPASVVVKSASGNLGGNRSVSYISQQKGKGMEKVEEGGRSEDDLTGHALQVREL